VAPAREQARLYVEAAWRDGLREQFAAAVTAERAKTQQLADLAQQNQHPQPDIDLLDTVPVTAADISRLPEPLLRRLFDAFHLQVRYHVTTGEIILRASVHADTAPALAAVIGQVIDPPPSAAPTHAATAQKQPAGEVDTSPAGNKLCDALRAPGGIRTHTVWILSPPALPLAYRGVSHSGYLLVWAPRHRDVAVEGHG
jgi:hypothetical protein